MSTDKPSYRALFTPKLLTVLREGYGLADLQRDALAGLTVAVVALPLSMALAIASGSDPGTGLTTAIVAGLIVSLFGGSRFQIAGPTGAFIPVVYAVIQHHGMDGLLLATIMAGLILMAAALMKVGTLMKYIPQPLITGFTGSAILPGVLYLQALGLDKERLVQGMGLIFCISTAVLMIAFTRYELLTLEVTGLSSLALIPALAGLYLGAMLRRRIAEERFRRLLFWALIVLGIGIVWRTTH